LVLLLIQSLVGPFQSLSSELGLERVFLGVDLSALDFFFLEFVDAVFFALSAHSFDSIWPILNALLAQSLKLLAVHRSCSRQIERIDGA